MTERTRRCERCGGMAAADARFCSRCGARLEAQPEGPSLKKVLWGAALGFAALLLGAMGACFFLAGVGGLTGGVQGLPWAVVMLLLAVAAFAGVVRVVR